LRGDAHAAAAVRKYETASSTAGEIENWNHNISVIAVPRVSNGCKTI
jgi:hypothetical protein